MRNLQVETGQQMQFLQEQVGVQMLLFESLAHQLEIDSDFHW